MSKLATRPHEVRTVSRRPPSDDRDRCKIRLLTRLISGAAASASPFVAYAQVSTDLERAPTLTIERYSEDWSDLADPGNRTGHWTEPFKYIPFSDDDAVYLTIGLEARSRYESYENVNWGSSPNDDFAWHRLMPYADLHIGNVRFFAQPILSVISGADRPKRPVDTTGTDMLQAFVDVDLALPGDASLRLSAGRKLVSLGSGRFIDRRYGTGVPLPFDGFEAIVTGKSRRVTGFYLQPVDTRQGDFNDRRSRDKAVWGVYATQWLDAKHAHGIDLYYIGLRDRNAVFDQGAGSQLAHTFGTRIFGDDGDWYWNAEAALQRGTFAGHRSSAWGVGAETGYRFRNAQLRPEIALTADVVSGDDDPNDAKLGTLNALFPNGKYFGALSPIGPRNLIHLRPSTAIHPHKTLALSLTGVAYWRQSLGDGIYAISGLLARSGGESDARFIGKQIEIATSWQATPELNLTASLSAFDPGPFIRDTGPARTIKMAGAQGTFRF
ncbi:alginate export family protein [Sphingomonas sanxanigenens]|uniref:alginate export family protein n=1 Tax=Sphingomonas sanxanigenens TaxID=397260 RepID=UPI0009FFD439|nr:alginate export family protein [Sphingomonas sanxanigenens]